MLVVLVVVIAGQASTIWILFVVPLRWWDLSLAPISTWESAFAGVGAVIVIINITLHLKPSTFLRPYAFAIQSTPPSRRTMLQVVRAVCQHSASLLLYTAPQQHGVAVLWVALGRACNHKHTH